MDPYSDCQLRQYCSKCLIEKTDDRTLRINSEIKEHIEDIRKDFLDKKVCILK